MQRYPSLTDFSAQRLRRLRRKKLRLQAEGLSNNKATRLSSDTVTSFEECARSSRSCDGDYLCQDDDEDCNENNEDDDFLPEIWDLGCKTLRKIGDSTVNFEIDEKKKVHRKIETHRVVTEYALDDPQTTHNLSNFHLKM